MIEDPKAVVARLRALPPEQRQAVLRAAGEVHVRGIDGDFAIWAHHGQQPDEGEWTVWVMMCGRGFGKTRAGAEWVSAKAREHPGAHIALVAANPQEARRVMVEGRSGLIAVARDGDERSRLWWEPGLGRLTFASGAQAFVYSGADGESLRGAEHHFAWCDELAKWRQGQKAWDNLMLGLRCGKQPQALVTTTPRSVSVLRAALAAAGDAVSGGTSWDNPFAAPTFAPTVERMYGRTRLGRQELLGELIDEAEGALWTRTLIERSRRGGAPDRRDMARVVIGVDPPVSAEGDECGIVACGLGEDDVAYVLGDHSAGGLSPERWARKVAGAAERWAADRIVAEGNQGGEMVESVLRGAGLRLPVTRVQARVGKAARAEPIAAFFETGEAKLAGSFPELEDQLCGLAVGGDYQGPGRSPDRADAMVYALTELLLREQRAEPRIRML